MVCELGHAFLLLEISRRGEIDAERTIDLQVDEAWERETLVRTRNATAMRTWSEDLTQTVNLNVCGELLLRHGLPKPLLRVNDLFCQTAT